MADMALQFDTGVRTLELTDGTHSVDVTFNPYDVIFLNRVIVAAEQLDKEQEKLSKLPTDDWKKVYEESVKADTAMKAIIDDLFGAPVCDALFAAQTVFALGNGFPAWSNLLYAVIEKMDTGLSAEKDTAQKRIRKYSEKYKR